MKLSLPLAVGCSLLLSIPLPACRAAEGGGNTPDAGQIGVSVGKALEQLHYTHHALDNGMSQRLLELYIETLDYNKLFFTQQDIDGFQKQYGTELDDDIMFSNLSPAYVIYDKYVKRVEARVAKVKALLKDEKFTFDGHGSIELSRQKSPWPKNEAEADQLWRDRVENEMLTERLGALQAEKKKDTETVTVDGKSVDKGANAQPETDPSASAQPDKPRGTVVRTDSADKKPADAPEVVVTKRYDRLLRSIHEQTKADETKFFLNSLALAYDPHSEYMSPEEMENFQINMRLSLIGIGAMLRSEDGYSKIIELIPGGPAALEGELKIDDRITAVAQGNGEFVDTVDMKLDKVVEMIRGKKNSQVRLQVIPAGVTDTSKRKVIAIKRDEVKLTEGEARAEIIERPNDHGGTDRLGWITLPGFYAEMDRGRGGGGTPKSTTADVRRLLERLNKEGISGLVMDLRRNGGGSLEESVNLTGLFIKKGPVVQVKSYDGHTDVLSDKDPSISYSGPMVVLTSHISASASEIFAGALQDYGRAVIVGDKSTFGKGTVQTLLEVGKFMSPFGFKMADAGDLKLTIQKFYRPSGQSTQIKGVESDVVLPSRYAHLEVGEDALKFPLPYDKVKPADYEKWPGQSPDLGELRARSAARVKAEPEFRYLEQDLAKMDERIHDNHLSLNLAERQAELAADKKHADEVKAERLARHMDKPATYTLTLADVDKPTLTRVANNGDKKDKADKPAKEKAASAKADAADQADAAATSADATSEDDVDALGNEREKPDVVDPIKTESLSILEDLAEQQRRGKLARTRD